MNSLSRTPGLECQVGVFKCRCRFTAVDYRQGTLFAAVVRRALVFSAASLPFRKLSEGGVLCQSHLAVVCTITVRGSKEAFSDFLEYTRRTMSSPANGSSSYMHDFVGDSSGCTASELSLHSVAGRRVGKT